MSIKTGQDLAKAKHFLESGKLVGIPTETVYGLAGNGFNAKAVASIFEAKKRPSFDPLILHTNSIEKVRGFVKEINPLALQLAKQFWPGPITLILPKKTSVPDLVTSGLETVAVRIPNHPLTLELLSSINFPLAAPSANVFGYISPTRPEHVISGLGDKVDYVLDGGFCQLGVESTIIKAEETSLTVLRKGGMEIEKLEFLDVPITVNEHSSSKPGFQPGWKPTAPGMLQQHYAPRTPIEIGNIETLISEKTTNKKIGILSFEKDYAEIPAISKVLSSSGNLSEAAQNLFTFLRELDNADVDIIFSELVPEHGLGRAINDRLKRAAS